MIKPELTIYVEDYNAPLNPWYIFNTETFSNDLSAITEGRLSMHSLFILKKDFVRWGANHKDFEKLAGFFSNKVENDNQFVKEVIKGHYRGIKKIKRFAKKLLAADLKNRTDKDLYKIYEQFYNLTKEIKRHGLTIISLDMGHVKYSDQVKKEIYKKLGGNPEITFSKLLTPIKKTELYKESQAILSLMKKIQADKNSVSSFKNVNRYNELSSKWQKKLQKLSRDFGWLQFYFLGPVASPDYYFDYIKKRINDDAKAELKAKREEARELKHFQNEYKKKFDTAKLKKIENLREFAFLKEARKEYQLYLMNWAMDKWFKEVAKRFFWTPLQARYIVRDEFKKLLVDSEKVIDSDELNKRYNCTACLLQDGEFKIYSGDKAEQYENLYIKEEKKVNEDIKEVKGTVAYPGRAKGIVKIVNSTNDLEKFNEGDVLVSFSTNPSLVPAMNKAAAIVTNTGGVTCHAAIVSRELKIPCVIGTKIATKVLKDGDEVEVDAESGVVKILKKHEK